jgi:hypothetical protein
VAVIIYSDKQTASKAIADRLECFPDLIKCLKWRADWP